jgi:NAD(P)H-hydrate epimerase
LQDRDKRSKSWQALKRQVVDVEWIRKIMPARPRDAHKGTFGTALIVAGSINYTGAALLAGEAAYRVGAGLVTLAVPAPLHSALAGQFPEATWLLLPHEMGVITEEASEVIFENLGRATAILIGPGLGMEDETGRFLARLIWSGTRSRRVKIGFVPNVPQEGKTPLEALPPAVIDADGLKHLARQPDWASRLPKPAVLTPHPGEMAILTGLEVGEIQANRLDTAEKYAGDWKHVVVLKGANTVIAAPDGRTAVVPVASPALARAGTGDVLAGLIVGLRAQGVEAYEAAVCGCWLHAQSGLAVAREMGTVTSVMAGDLLDAVITVISDLEE